MMKSPWLLGAMLTAGLLAAPQLARADVTLDVHNAGDLAAMCSAKLPDIHASAKENFCHGFAQGVVSSELERAHAAGPTATRAFCLPGRNGPSRSQTLAEFVRWIDAKPGERGGPTVATLVKFLGERFPCPKAPAPAAAAPR